MEIDLSAFHFLRPWWLLAIVAAGLILLARREHLGALGWRSTIAPALLPYLVVDSSGNRGPRPVHAVAALLFAGGIAAAGPTWTQDRPAFLDNQAPLILAVDVSSSMDATDVPPSRLEAVKLKLRDLVKQRAGAKTGLIAYAGSAHLVLPPTDDPDLLNMFIQALATNLIAGGGRDTVGAITVGKQLLSAGQSGGTLLLITDGVDTAELPAIERAAKNTPMQVMVLAVGVRDTGVLLDGRGQPRVDSHGKPLLGQFDPQALRQLAQAAGAPLGSLTVNGDDLSWVALHAARHFEAVQDDGMKLHWKDAGYWLCWPLALIALLSLRRGWNINWTACLVLAFAAGGFAPQAQAGAFTDAFFTADQQGRWAYEHKEYAKAASLFKDPYWKGRAAYAAADYTQALSAFATLDTPQGYFYLGNTQARMLRYGDALEAYDHAMRMQADFPDARFNRDLIARLLAAIEAEQENDNSQKPDEVVFDKTPTPGGKSVQVTVTEAASADLWLRNLTLSPSGFLRQKFAIEDARKAASSDAKAKP